MTAARGGCRIRHAVAAGLALAALAVLAALDALANLWPALHPARRTVTGAPQESDGRIVARCLGLAFAGR